MPGTYVLKPAYTKDIGHGLYADGSVTQSANRVQKNCEATVEVLTSHPMAVRGQSTHFMNGARH